MALDVEEALSSTRRSHPRWLLLASFLSLLDDCLTDWKTILRRIAKYVEECNSQTVSKCYPYRDGYEVNSRYEEQNCTGYFFVLNSTAYSYSYQPLSLQPTTYSSIRSSRTTARTGVSRGIPKRLPSHIALRWFPR